MCGLRRVGLGDDPHDAAVAQRPGDDLRDEVGVKDVVAVGRSLPQAEIDQFRYASGRAASKGRMGAGMKVTVSFTSRQSPGAAFAVIRSATWL